MLLSTRFGLFNPMYSLKSGKFFQAGSGASWPDRGRRRWMARLAACSGCISDSWEGPTRSSPDNQLSGKGLGPQGVITAHRRCAINAQALRLTVHGDRQHANIRISENIAEALEHAISIVVGKSKYDGPTTRTKPGIPPLKEQWAAPCCIGCRQKEICCVLNDCLVSFSELAVG